MVSFGGDLQDERDKQVQVVWGLRKRRPGLGCPLLGGWLAEISTPFILGAPVLTAFSSSAQG